jgi:hypothetical protein
VTNTLLSDCAEAETYVNGRIVIKRNRNAGIIGGINGLQIGGRELVELRKGILGRKKYPVLGIFHKTSPQPFPISLRDRPPHGEGA